MARVLKIILCALAAWFVLGEIVAPRPDRARRFSPEEITAIGAIRTIHTTQVQYFSQYGRYAGSLSELGELASGTKVGYRFTMTGNTSGYVIHADPESYGKTGSRAFYSDATMTIRQNSGQEPATINSPEMK
jgi:type IV pilus assembly protein PilA